MKRSEQQPGADATILHFKLPVPLRIVLSGIAILLCYELYAAIASPSRYVSTICMFGLFGGLGALLYFNNAGYRIAWDEDRLYMRGWGIWARFPRYPQYHSIRYDDMVAIEGRFQNDGVPVSQLIPYEYLAVVSTEPTADEIWIYPQSLRKNELVQLLIAIDQRRPGLLQDAIANQIRESSPAY